MHKRKICTCGSANFFVSNIIAACSLPRYSCFKWISLPATPRVYSTRKTPLILMSISESQACMSGFLDEDVLRSKAALIGRTVSRQREQVIIPGISFTCAGTITEWIFVAERNTGGGRNRYPELQVWRLLQNSVSTYNLVHSVAVSPQSTSQRNVYIHTLLSTIQYQPGDVLGIYYPPSDTSAYKILSVQHGGPDNYHTARQDHSNVRFDIQSPPVRVHRDYPLVGIQTGQDYLFITMWFYYSVLPHIQTTHSVSLVFSVEICSMPEARVCQGMAGIEHCQINSVSFRP